MNSTAKRVPRITGLPAGTSGFTMMRSESAMTTVYRQHAVQGQRKPSTCAHARRALDYAGLAKVMRRRQFLMRTELPNKWRSGACA